MRVDEEKNRFSRLDGLRAWEFMSQRSLVLCSHISGKVEKNIDCCSTIRSLFLF